MAWRRVLRTPSLYQRELPKSYVSTRAWRIMLRTPSFPLAEGVPQVFFSTACVVFFQHECRMTRTRSIGKPEYIAYRSSNISDGEQIVQSQIRCVQHNVGNCLHAFLISTNAVGLWGALRVTSGGNLVDGLPPAPSTSAGS